MGNTIAGIRKALSIGSEQSTERNYFKAAYLLTLNNELGSRVTYIDKTFYMDRRSGQVVSVDQSDRAKEIFLEIFTYPVGMITHSLAIAKDALLVAIFLVLTIALGIIALVKGLRSEQYNLYAKKMSLLSGIAILAIVMDTIGVFCPSAANRINSQVTSFTKNEFKIDIRKAYLDNISPRRNGGGYVPETPRSPLYKIPSYGMPTPLIQTVSPPGTPIKSKKGDQ